MSASLEVGVDVNAGLEVGEGVKVDMEVGMNANAGLVVGVVDGITYPYLDLDRHRLLDQD